MKKIIALTAATLLTGCTATNTLPERALADGQDYLMPIHVMVDDPMNSSTLRNHLRQTGVFRDVQTGTAKGDEYSVQVKLNMQREFPPFPVVLLSCATLFMLPLSKEYNTEAEFSVYQGDKRLKQYSYRNTTQKYTWLLDQGGELEGQNLSRIARAFAQDVQHDHLIPASGAAQ
ncbi:hypothetical protein A8L59_13065 [Pseudomonas koreensis]|jgi:hypothetical protein|uniref:Lipoprotein n=1 Tax=Pseudomonas koreensis TaxID=198620 RepID=A0AAC9FWM6_9PSED|nr:hypothetical protein [Pseudomonas koreensis]ANH98299.1 hypothetical protein A8L59_13065 [Pseudomonas koreensis]